MTLSPILSRSSPDKGKTWIPSLDESPFKLGIGSDSEVAAVDIAVENDFARCGENNVREAPTYR
jgi:hypothetical protein